MDDLERAILATALRIRPETVAELAEIMELPPERTRALLDDAVRSGLLSRDGEQLRYLRPDRHVADRIDEIAARQQQRLAEDLDELRTLSAQLPGLVTEWFSGADEHAFQVEVVHGLDSGNDLWRHQTAHGVPRFARAVLPDLHRFLEPGEQQARFLRTMADNDSAAQAIIATSDARLPEIAAQLPRLRAAGLDVRMHPRPPSWFWLHDDRTAAVPLAWGEAWPTSVMALHSAVIVGALDELFRRLWRESVPVEAEDRDWTDLLRLMRTGLTLDAASRTLGISPRTGRRRIADAMAHYGAETLFGLGAAWAAAGDADPT